MGMPPFFSGGSSDPGPTEGFPQAVESDPARKSPPAPQAHRFSIRGTKQRGAYLIALVHYPDATTFGGDKLMIFESSAGEFWDREKIDPHFLGDIGDPIARFPATGKGRDMAQALVTAMLEEEKGKLEES